MNSNKKGKVGEREFAQFLRHNGFKARRGVQHAGSPDSPDVVHNIPGVHFEVKRTETLQMHKAMEQAENDCGDSKAVVAYRRNEGEWLVILKASDFCDMVKDNVTISRDELISVISKFTPGSVFQ